MSDPPEHQPAVIALQIKQLEKAITELGVAMREGFDRLERKLDERLASRDERLDEHDDQIRELQMWRSRIQAFLLIAGAALAVALPIIANRAFGA